MGLRQMNGKRCLAVCLVVWLALGQSFPVVAAETAAYEEYRSGSLARQGEDGRKDYTEVHVSTEGELVALARDCRVDSWSVDKKVILDADIALVQEKDLSIPSFGGIFEGNGYSIAGIDVTKAGSAMGLFRYVQEGGIVRNLTVSGKVSPGGSKSQVGGIVGVNYGRLENCSFGGTVTGDTEVGGIAGVNAASGTIRRCTSRAAVTGNHSTGGIAGSNQGVLNNCSNAGAVNVDGTEVDYGLEDVTEEALEDVNSASNMAAHTDSGGIAGISSGKVYYCTNTGTVGYHHVGYNTGGIVGRLSQGYLQNCTNSGHVMGRKDVGGIAGQMEPFLEVQYLEGRLQKLDRETDELIDLLDAAHEDLSSCGKSAGEVAKAVTADLKRVNQAGSVLSNTAMDLWYVYNQELTGINNDLKVLNEELKEQGKGDKEPGNGTGTDGAGAAGTGTNGTDATGMEPNGAGRNGAGADGTDATGAGTNGTNVNGTGTGDAGTNGTDATGAGTSDAGTNGTGGASAAGSSEHPDKTPLGAESDRDFRMETPDGNRNVVLPDDTESYRAALRRFGDNLEGHVDRMTSATDERTGGIRDNLQIVNSGLESAGNGLERLVDILEDGTDVVSSDVDAVIEQAKKVRRLISEIRDDLFRYEGIAVEDTSDEAAGGVLLEPGAGEAAQGAEEAYYDTESFQMGKITQCLNQGLIEADTNVGGIVGQISVEFDFDPEDDVTLTGAESFELEQTVKAVVRESRNLGDVSGKKNYVGGIVGKAEHGAVISCESYCAVSGTDYVGGIVGKSRYAVRSCYAMGDLFGKDYVGGIAGKGCDVFYSYAYSRVEASGENAGAIAGQVEEEGALSENYYVAGELGGIDGIGYIGGAAPLSYEEFCSREGVPQAFSDFELTFMAGGRVLATLPCKYGEAIDRDRIPDIPAREGYYGEWPECDFSCVTGSRVLEAQYKKWITSLASEERDPSGRPEVLVEGKFYPGTALRVVRGDAAENDAEPAGREEAAGSAEGASGSAEGASAKASEGHDVYVLSLEGEGDLAQPVRVRVLCHTDKDAGIEVLSGGTYQPVACERKGSYLMFGMEGPGTFRIVEAEPGGIDWRILLTAVSAVLILGVVTAAVVKRGKRAGKRRKPADKTAGTEG